ncbi:SRPBCC family protein [Paenibacillus thalictri]|uniref:SRPBCC family protein n=1 Tax=Paenibacillus thalictri TaxID=2527873 RepID=A0A4Q9DGJ0_9BACL|nr:SRPBCC family protein [Paenibacillus thalictri]TBL71349.1 SRPBCC family protein [Paenibacillus thalictri]
MLAVIQKSGDGYTVRYERRLKHSVEKVWSYLTENEKLSRWFSELRVEDLREGGSIQFAMPDGTFIEMKILELTLYSVLEYTWAEDIVRLELYPESYGCRLVMIETLTKLTDHTPKDVAGWDVCLDVIEMLLEGKTIESRMDLWKIKYELYVQEIARLT